MSMFFWSYFVRKAIGWIDSIILRDRADECSLVLTVRAHLYQINALVFLLEDRVESIFWGYCRVFMTSDGNLERTEDVTHGLL